MSDDVDDTQPLLHPIGAARWGNDPSFVRHRDTVGVSLAAIFARIEHDEPMVVELLNGLDDGEMLPALSCLINLTVDLVHRVATERGSSTCAVLRGFHGSDPAFLLVLSIVASAVQDESDMHFDVVDALPVYMLPSLTDRVVTLFVILAAGTGDAGDFFRAAAMDVAVNQAFHA